jgi:hypothetical protein
MTGSQLLWAFAMLMVSVVTVIIAVQFNLFSAVFFWTPMVLLLLMLIPER